MGTTGVERNTRSVFIILFCDFRKVFKSPCLRPLITVSRQFGRVHSEWVEVSKAWWGGAVRLKVRSNAEGLGFPRGCLWPWTPACPQLACPQPLAPLASSLFSSHAYWPVIPSLVCWVTALGRRSALYSVLLLPALSCALQAGILMRAAVCIEITCPVQHK